MATFTLTDATCWVGGYDFTGDLNQIQLSASVNELDATTFGSGGFRSRIGGLRDVQASLAGYWSSDTSAAPDPHLMPDLGVADRVVTIAPNNTEGGIAYMFQGAKFTTSLFGSVGELTPFSLDVMGTNKAGLVRGQVLKAKGTVSAAGATGTAVELGEAADGQYLYATFHVFGAGTTITAVLESDVDNTFASATTQATFGPITTTGGTWAARVAGPVTDTWYRLRVTAVTGTFSIAGAAGIGS
ncbi:MAG TPA: hypothetical protein VF174_07335 [Micromonosporaceae bacterium]